MLQGIVSPVLNYVTVHVQLEQVEQPRHLLALTFTVSLALTEHQTRSGTPTTHSGMAKAATVVASAAIPVMHRGSSRPCLRRLRLTLKSAGARHMQGLSVTERALSNLKFMSSNKFHILAIYSLHSLALFFSL